jgi:hypothetical protein
MHGDKDAAGVDLVIAVANSSGDNSIDAAPFAALGQPVDLSLTHVTNTPSVRCQAVSGVAGAQIVGSIPFQSATGGVGLHLRAANARWDWLMVVEGPVTP